MESQVQARDERRMGLFTSLLVLFILVAGVVSFFIAAKNWWLPPLASASRTAAEIDQFFYAILIATGIAFVAVHIFLVLSLARYGARGTERAAHWHEHLGAELTWTLVPAAAFLILGILGEVVWAHIYSVPPANAQRVEVTGRQFLWYIRYPGPDGKLGRRNPALVSPGNPLGLDPKDPAGKDDVVAINDLHLIAGRPVAIRVSSVDVIHSFFLPNFRVKQDAVPGRTVEIWFIPGRPGAYQIACAQLCGIGHYTMRGNVTVGTQADFNAWLRSQAQH
jgi:cytochrome c oxidase subunit II